MGSISEGIVKQALSPIGTATSIQVLVVIFYAIDCDDDDS